MKQRSELCLAVALFVSSWHCPQAAEPPPEGARPARQTATLPLSEVILYSSGVGYFERLGEVEGNAKIDLRFKVDDINDLLKSMVVQDFGGGQISTVTYGSRDPITKTLKSFGIDLTDNPTLGQLLNQARGELVEVMRPGPLSGTILGVENKLQPAGENKTVEVEFLNLLTADGLQSVPLSQIQRTKLINERLNTELRQALEVLAAGHDTQKKTVTVAFAGAAKRKVAVSYIVQTPVWKTSYRLVLDDQEPPFLQGWAIVENTSDEDWSGVRLALVSGRPISFTMDLYQPLYATRPQVEPELYLSLRPQVYSDAIESKDRDQAAVKLSLDRRDANAFFGAEAARLGAAGGRARGVAPMSPAAPLAKSARAEAALGERETLGRRLNLDQGIAASSQGGEAGELFQYQITAPVTLARQQSAMLPILNQKVQGEKISIYNQSVQAKHPLNGLRLKNTSSLHLMQGPVTVFDGGTYAGDARIEDLAPNQERLLSYALDLKTEIEPQTTGSSQDLVSVKIQKGLLVAVRKMREEKSYTLRNRDQKKKQILIEHPFRAGWQLVEPKEPAERARDAYRFAVTVEPEKSAKLVVREENQLSETAQLANSSSEMIAVYLRAQQLSARVKQALQKFVSLRERASQTAGERSRREQRINEITDEQARIRENMTRLSQQSELYSRYVKKLDEQETELERLRQEIESLKSTEKEQQRELNEFLANLSVE
ncbi:MAG: DUF4139 domain-containing protein [Verrucomicrobia bacterium]|nr:DUF4139 domain-containing protein [Verrucomicrobiota bacterium]